MRVKNGSHCDGWEHFGWWRDRMGRRRMGSTCGRCWSSSWNERQGKILPKHVSPKHEQQLSQWLREHFTSTGLPLECGCGCERLVSMAQRQVEEYNEVLVTY